MTQEQKRDELYKAIATSLEIGGERVKPEAVLLELGPWDSLAVMTMVVAVDEIYGRVVHGRALSECVTVADVVRVAEGA